MNFPQNPPRPTPLAPRNARPARIRVRPRGRKIDVPRGGKNDGSIVREKIAEHGTRTSNVLSNGHEFIVDAAAIAKRGFTAEGKIIDAMMNGGTCEACQKRLISIILIMR